jgi:hypothetical protein
MEKTKVIFRVDESNGEVVALFPRAPADVKGLYCTCFTHVGQHGRADHAFVVRHTRAATAAEAFDLADELKGRGYKLVVARRVTARDTEERLAAARGIQESLKKA